MKILFTADIHIKLGQKNVPVNWAKNRYAILWKYLDVYSSRVDLTVIGGDIFDKLPNMEELELYFSMLNHINSKCIIYSGNHEAVKKNTTFLTNLAAVTNRVNSRVQIIDDFYSVENIDFIPYNKLKEYDPRDIDLHGDVLCTHVRGDIPPHVKAEFPLELFDRWKLVLAGDLHSYSNSQRNILYPGSPITTSFHRTSVETGFLIVDSESFEHSWHAINVPQLLRKSVKSVGEMMPTDFDHTIYDLEGDMLQVSGVESDLLDKKIIKRPRDSTLILDKEMSVVQEVEEYLKYVLGLNETSAHEVIKELHHHVHKFE